MQMGLSSRYLLSEAAYDSPKLLSTTFAGWHGEANNGDDLNPCLLRIGVIRGPWNNAPKRVKNEGAVPANRHTASGWGGRVSCESRLSAQKRARLI